jgi:hypothetical protein
MYRKLGLAIGVNVVLMYLIGFVMIAEVGHFENNINRAYMAFLMAAPMVIIMLLVMRSMFPDRKLNLGLHAASAIVILLVYMLIRTQTPVGNEQFLRSMIPHHSSAILMCDQARITDPEITGLCEEIVRAQKAEIAQMQAIMARY